MEIEADQVLTANLVPHEHGKDALENISFRNPLGTIDGEGSKECLLWDRGGMDLLDALMLGSEDLRDQTENLSLKLR